MVGRSEHEEPDRLLRLALGGGSEEWTPKCPEPEDLLDLYEQGAGHVRSETMLAHVADCAHCRRAFAEAGEAVRLGAAIRGEERRPPEARTRAHRFRTRLAGSPPQLRLAWAVAAVFALLLAGWGNVWWDRRSSPPSEAALRGQIAQLQRQTRELDERRRRGEQRIAAAERDGAQARRQADRALAAGHAGAGQAARLRAADAKIRTANAQLRTANAHLLVANAHLRVAQKTPPALPAPGPPSPWSKTIVAAVRVAPDQVALLASGAALRGGAPGELPVVGRLRPVATFVLEDRPTFGWGPVAGAGQYRLTLTDSDDRVLHEATLSGITWAAPRPLPRGRVYRWQVAAFQGGREVARSPEATFGVAPAKTVAALARARLGALHLQMGQLYLQAHLLDDAERELDAVRPGDPDYAAVHTLLRHVQQERGR